MNDFERETWLRILSVFLLLVICVQIVVPPAEFIIAGSRFIDSMSKFPVGLGTIIGAVIGLSAVAWQTKVGFRNLIHAQDHRADVERQARREQKEHEECRRIIAEEREKRVLAAALQAELATLHQGVWNATAMFRASAVINQEISKIDPRRMVPVIQFPSFSTPMFDKKHSDLGNLGVSVAFDVLQIYSLVSVKQVQSGKAEIYAQVAADLSDVMVKAFKNWPDESLHVQRRLGAVQGFYADPGTLYEFRQKRDAEAFES